MGFNFNISFKQGAEVSFHAKEVSGYSSTIKTSVTWEEREPRDGMLISKIHTEVLCNFEEMKELMAKESIEGIKEFTEEARKFIKNYPDGMKKFIKDHDAKAENEETADDFSIKEEVVWERDIRDLESIDFHEMVNDTFAFLGTSIYYHSPEVEYMSSI